MTFTLIHPSRSRPQKSFDTISKWIKNAGDDDFEIIIALDSDDPLSGQYQQIYYAQKLSHPFTLMVNENKNAIEAINRAARIAQGRIFIVVSDDTAPCPAWSIKLKKYTEGRIDFVLKVRDGIQPVMITMAVLDRTYYQRFGYIYNPEYKHAFADREFTEVAMKLKKVITKNIMFRHEHYSITKHKIRDEQYARTDATFNEGRSIFIRRKKMNFGL